MDRAAEITVLIRLVILRSREVATAQNHEIDKGKNQVGCLIVALPAQDVTGGITV
jgi:hypothetical protein